MARAVGRAELAFPEMRKHLDETDLVGNSWAGLGRVLGTLGHQAAREMRRLEVQRDVGYRGTWKSDLAFEGLRQK